MNDLISNTGAASHGQLVGFHQTAISEACRLVPKYEGDHRGAVAGVSDCYLALCRLRVVRLCFSAAFAPDLGWECRECLATSPCLPDGEICSVCGGEVSQRFDVKEEMIVLAENQGCEIDILDGPSASALPGGVACILKR